jgi:hypothetical protein
MNAVDLPLLMMVIVIDSLACTRQTEKKRIAVGIDFFTTPIWKFNKSSTEDWTLGEDIGYES